MGDFLYHKNLRQTRNLMAKFEKEVYTKAMRRLMFERQAPEYNNFRQTWEIPPELEQELDSFIGQTSTKEALEIAIISAIKRQKPIDHMMFVGPPGLGKSTLARKIAKIMNLPFYSYTGQSLSKSGEISNMIKFVHTQALFAVIFIDEIHSIKKGISEELFEVLQDFSYHGQTIKRFTCIGATTSPGAVIKPLRDRFNYIFRLKPYSHEEIKQILCKIDKNISVKAADLIASRSNGTPRIAIALYQNAKNIATYCESSVIKDKHCLFAMKLGGVDDLGLNSEHIQVLKLLRDSGKAVGRSTICAALNIDDSELIQIIEPTLLSNGLIIRVPRGREITNKGIEYINSHE